MSSDLKYAPKVGELRVVDSKRWLWVSTHTTSIELRLNGGDVVIVLEKDVELHENSSLKMKLLSRRGVCYADPSVVQVHTELL